MTNDLRPMAHHNMTHHELTLRQATLHQTRTRGVSLVEVAVAVVVITIMAVSAPRVLSQLVSASETELQSSISDRIAESWLAASIADDYDNVTAFTNTVETISFQRGSRTYTVTYVVDREVVEDTSMTAPIKHVRIRVRWPDAAAPVGETIKATIISRTN